MSVATKYGRLEWRFERFRLIYAADHAVAQTVSRRFPPQRSRFEPGSNNAEFVVDKATLVQVFSEYFCFACQSFHWLLHTHNYPGLIQ
jgi:hypothetical protein